MHGSMAEISVVDHCVVDHRIDRVNLKLIRERIKIIIALLSTSLLCGPSVERKLQEQAAEDSAYLSQLRAQHVDQMQHQADKQEHARKALSMLQHDLVDAFRQLSLGQSRQLSDEQLSAFKSYIASTLSTMQDDVNKRQVQWRQKQRAQLQRHAHELETPLTNALAHTVSHMQHLQGSLQQQAIRSCLCLPLPPSAASLCCPSLPLSLPLLPLCLPQLPSSLPSSLCLPLTSTATGKSLFGQSQRSSCAVRSTAAATREPMHAREGGSTAMG